MKLEVGGGGGVDGGGERENLQNREYSLKFLSLLTVLICSYLIVEGRLSSECIATEKQLPYLRAQLSWYSFPQQLPYLRQIKII